MLYLESLANTVVQLRLQKSNCQQVETKIYCWGEFGQESKYH